jgi:Integrase core domain
MVDVATGWVACAGLRDKRSETVFHALRRLQADLPFRILGLDSDNGTEFINRALLDYCTEHGITFTRSRPYLKNDTLSRRTEKLGGRAPPGRLRPPGVTSSACARVHPSSGWRLHQLPASSAQAGEQIAQWSACQPPLRRCHDTLSPTSG